MKRFAKQLSMFGERDEPLVAPTERDWMDLEMYFKFRLPKDYKDFVAEAASYWFEGEIPTGRITGAVHARFFHSVPADRIR